MRILHVLTLNSRNGEYGGPVRVARELCRELNNLGHVTHIFSGALTGFEPEAVPDLSESQIVLKPILKNFPLSSLWSWKLIVPLNGLIKKSDIVHIHFARDLVPFLAAIFAFLNHKPFITQTHGMIRKENSAIKKLVDFLFTVPILKRAQSNLVLSALERKHLNEISPKLSPIIFRNGISHTFLDLQTYELSEKRKVIFCSRINEKKRVSVFLEIAKEFSKLDQIDFLIFGPDGGELKLVLDKISEFSQKNIATTKYLGPLLTGEVTKVFANVDLLILPSLEDAYPMVVLESLSVGTPVLISRFCGNADDVKLIDPEFVCTSDGIGEYVTKTKSILQKYSLNSNRDVLKKLSLEFFDIKPLTKSLVELYKVATFKKENLTNES